MGDLTNLDDFQINQGNIQFDLVDVKFIMTIFKSYKTMPKLYYF